MFVLLKLFQGLRTKIKARLREFSVQKAPENLATPPPQSTLSAESKNLVSLPTKCESSVSAAMATALKSIKSIAPLLDRILVQRIKAETKTAGGILLPESSVKELNEAKVLAVGPGALDKEGKRITPSVAPGDKVLIPQYGGSALKVGDEEYSLFRDHELLAKINE